jgi:hypothetical protein
MPRTYPNGASRFSIVQRKVLTPLDVASEEALTQRLLGFQDYYQERAQPFS